MKMHYNRYSSKYGGGGYSPTSSSSSSSYGNDTYDSSRPSEYTIGGVLSGRDGIEQHFTQVLEVSPDQPTQCFLN